MNRIYRVVWNRTLGRSVVGPEFMRAHGKEKSALAARAGLAAAVALIWAGGFCPVWADVTVADPAKYGNRVEHQGDVYEIANQEIKGSRVLNRFDKFDIASNEVANLHLGNAAHQINIVNQKMNVDGVVNALQNGKIGGDVYFFSDKGIAIGKTGVINVGRLTLGTNPSYGEKLYKDGFDAHNKLTAARQANAVAGDHGAITMAGTIYTQGDVVLGTKKDLTVNGSIYAGLGKAGETQGTKGSASDIRSSLVNLKNTTSATKVKALGNGDVALYTEDTLTVAGSAAAKANVKTLGGSISLTSSSHDAKLQADPADIPGDGMISIKDAYLDTGATDRDSGQVTIRAERDVMGVARVDVDDSTIDASGRNGQKAGDVAISASASTKLYSWDIGDGAYAQVKMGKESSGRNTILGDSIAISADATTAADVSSNGGKSDADMAAAEKKASKAHEVLAFMEDTASAAKTAGLETVKDLRAIAQATKVAAGADVDVVKTDMQALGNGGDAADHGNLSLKAAASSAVSPTATLDAVGFGVNVGISDVTSHVNVDDSQLYAAGNLDMDAAGDNTVSMAYIDFNLLDKYVRSTVNFSWAELHSDVSAKAGKEAVLTSGKDTSLSAVSTRQLSSSVSNGGDATIVGLAVSVAQADTKAEAQLAGTAYAGGSVKVSAENTLAKSGNLWAADTTKAAAVSGISGLSETVDFATGIAGKAGSKAAQGGRAVKGKAKELLNVIKTKLSRHAEEVLPEDETLMDEMLDMEEPEPGGQGEPGEAPAAKKPWNALGINGATALLFSHNTAEAGVTGKVRGLSGTKTDGKYVGSDAEGAASLAVTADTLSRTAAKAAVDHADPPEETGADQKAVTVSAGVIYTAQRNDSQAYISGDVKTTGDVTVKADTRIPWQTKVAAKEPADILMNMVFTAIDGSGYEVPSYLVDSWNQTSGGGKTASGAASVSVVEYNNSASAFIGKKDASQTTAPSVEAGGAVDVAAKTDITTVNFGGTIPNFLNKAPINLLPNIFQENTRAFLNTKGWKGEDAAKNGLGGVALAVWQKNHTKAYIDDGAAVKASAASVKADTEAWNLSVAAAGGIASSLALDATVGINRVDNQTEAYVGDGSLTAVNDVDVAAKDYTVNVNVAGTGALSQGAAAVGASVGYNHIMRDTTAHLGGTVKAGGTVDVSARNDGEIISTAVAGSATYEQPKKVDNLAGSRGLYVDEEGHVEMEMQDLVREMADEEEADDLNHLANENIQGIVEEEPAMEDNVGEAKNGLAIAANVAVNRVKDSAKAYVAKGTGDSAPQIRAAALALDSANDSAIYSTSGALSANMPALNRQNTLSIAGSFMYNAIENTNEAYVDGAELTLSGSTEEGKDESLAVTAENKERILNIAGSGSGAASGSAKNLAAAGQISLNRVKNQTQAYVKDSTVEAGEASHVSAVDAADTGSYTGAVEAVLGGKGHAVGASIGVNLLGGTTSAYMEGTKFTGLSGGKGGSVSVSAEDKKELTAILASGGVAKGFTGAFTAVGNRVDSTTDAHISTEKGMNVGALSVSGANHSNATLMTGSLSIGENSAGASVGVMVNKSGVKASLTGDAGRQRAISADSISVKADNVYNGSASDSESDSTAKNMAVGFAAGSQKFAGSGSVTVNVIKQTADALLGKGLYEARQGTVDVNAHTKANLFGLAGGAAVSKGSGIGAAVDVQHYTGHTYAGLADGAHLSQASAVNVAAASEERMTSVGATLASGANGFGGAGAAGAHSISTDTKAYVGNDKDTETADAAVLTEAGAVSVTASDTTKLGTGAGTAGLGSKAGVGLTAAVEVVKKKVNAYVGNHTNISGSSLAVEADNTTSAETGTAGLGAGGSAGVAGSFSETFVNHATHAYVGKNASVTVTDGAGVNAVSSFNQKSWAGGAGFAPEGAGVGIVNATAKLDADTKAYVDDNAIVDGGSHVNIGAAHDTHLTYATVAGGAGGYAGVDGAVGVNVLSMETKAYAGEGASLSAAKAAEQTDSGISLTAQDTTWLEGGNGGGAVGVAGAGVGAAVAVNTVKKDTEAYVGQSASIDTAGTTTISAENTEHMLNVTLQGAGGTYTGVAGAVNVNVLDVTTKAFTNTGVKLNQTQGKNSGAVTVDASHEIKELNNTAVGAAGGIVGVGAAVDVGVVRTQTNAYLGDNNKVYSGGAVSVTATDNMHDISTKPWAGGIGAVGLSGSVSVYSFGGQLSQEDKQSLSGKNEKGEDVNLDTWVAGEINSNAQLQKAMGAYDGYTNALSDVKDSIATTYDVTAPDTTGEKGTLAKVGKNTVIDAAGGVTVKAEDTLKVKPILGNLSAGIGAVGSTVSVVHTDTDTKAFIDDGASVAAGGDVDLSASSNHDLNSTIIGASVAGGVAGQGTVGVWVDRADVSALAGDVEKISAKNVSVTSSNTHTLNGSVGGASVAILGLNGAVQTASISGTSTAALGSETGTRKGMVEAEKDVTVSAKAKTDLRANATGAAVGLFGGQGAGTSLFSDVASKASIGKGVKTAGKNISVTASNTPKLYAHANGLALGGAAVGVSVAETDSSDSAVVTVADGAELRAEKSLTLTADVAPPENAVTIDTQAIAGSGGVIGNVAAAVSGAILHQTSAVEVGKDAVLSGKNLSLTAKHTDSGDTVMDSMGAAIYSGNGGDVRYSSTSEVHVKVGDGTSLTGETVKILADNSTVKNEKKENNGLSAGASAVGGTGVVSHTNISHTTAVDLGKVTVSGGMPLTEDEKKAGTSFYDKGNVIAIDAASHISVVDKAALTTGAAVAAARAENTTEAKADTSVTVAEGASLTAGDVDTVKVQATDRDLLADQAGFHGADHRGGSIGIGTKNDADLYGSTLVDVYGAGGYAGSKNNVTYTGTATTRFDGSAETAKGDIRVAAGRDSSGTAGDSRVVSHSDILNATIIPISVISDPLSKWDSQAQLAVGGSLSSDRDVYLQSNPGSSYLSATGAVKDWVNALFGSASGAEGYGIGEARQHANAETHITGTVEAGIHRNRNVRFWGEPQKDANGNLTGKWKLYTDRDGMISYTVTSSVPVGTDIVTRYEKLKTLQGDAAAMAAYEAEMKFLEQKMVEQGLGYYVTAKDGSRTFVYTPGSVKSEYDTMTEKLARYTQLAQDAEPVYKQKQTELTTRTGALADLQAAYKKWADAEEGGAKAQAAEAYRNAAKSYDTTYKTSFDVTPDESLAAALKTEADGLQAKQETYTEAVDWVKKTLSQMKGQIDATDDFFTKKGGTEEQLRQMEQDANGEYMKAGGYAYNNGHYFLLHKELYNQMTRSIVLDDVDATLGDIHLEGDTVYGSGSLSAPGNAKVTITNETPYNLNVGHVTVAGAGGTSGVGTGGRITLNGTAVAGKTSADIAANIRARNRDQAPGKDVFFTSVTRDITGASDVTVKSTFAPTETRYQNTGDAQSVFTAPSLHLTGLIYNPRGAVTASSTKGDVYTEGSIIGGRVSITADNGDYIQSYNPNYRVFSAGGTPLKDDGSLNKEVGSGILANGNVFISARYVNINSTIQSGQETFEYHIPKEFQLYYKKDGSPEKITVEQAKNSPDQTYYVEGVDEKLTYDAKEDRFVLSGVEVHGGHVSIVGTIINTSKEGASAGKIRALDGYGTISIKNDSTKTLELRNLDTGEGVSGSISITDLDKETGKALHTTVYTRGTDGISWTKTLADGTVTTDTAGGASTTYQPQAELYYSLQTGSDGSTTNRYELHRKNVIDWWGIKDKTPTKEDLLAQGGQLVASTTGTERALNGGYYVSGTAVTGTKLSGDGHYITSENTYVTDDKAPVEKWDIQSSRKVYYLGMAKDWDVTLEETVYHTSVKQYAVKADYPVGIEFFGNEEGGSLSAAGSGNIIITGVLSNKAGTTFLSGADITQTAGGFISAKDLTLRGTGDVGHAAQAIRTDAATLTGSAGGHFVVSAAGALQAGSLTAGKTLSLTADGDISQKGDTLVKAKRIELDAGSGSISGGTGSDFQIQAGEGLGADYGLKARAEGDIAITNNGGSLYLDSVTSGRGSVSLTTDGSFVDNNYTDMENLSATAKLKAWADAAVLEKESTTIAKQKKLLTNRVMEKYNEYQNLAAHVQDGVYTLSETEKTALPEGTDLNVYVAQQQKRYDELKDTVGTWTKAGVQAYIDEIKASGDSIYGNAALQADALSGDTYLTREEKANVLVGSAKSARDLLITFTPGGIKEGITDTRTTQKQTPHVTGTSVTLTARGDAVGTSGSGNIGTKTTQDIDVSDVKIKDLTADQLIALAAAERGDFKWNGNTVTVTSIRPIEAEAAGVVKASAEHGALYLHSPGGIVSGSSFTAESDLRLKTAGDLKDITVTSGGQTVLESGSGAISGVTLSGSGTLTARAEKGVDISKDGDLTINTLYASEGDVKVNLTGGSLYAESGGSDEDYIHIGGNNITITGAENILGKGTPATVGMKVYGENGVLSAAAAGTADITLLGTAGAGHTISAKDLTLRNRGGVEGGSYTGTGSLTVHNGEDAAIHSGTFTGTGTLTVENKGSVDGGTFTGGTVALSNEGTLGGTYTATGVNPAAGSALTYRGGDNASLMGASLTAEKGSMSLTGGRFQDVTLTADGTVTADTDKDAGFENVSGTDVTLFSRAGLTAETVQADHAASLTAGGALHVDSAEAGTSLTLAGDTVSAGTLHAGGAASLTSTGALKAENLTAGGHASLSSSGGDVELGTVEAESADVHAHGRVTADAVKTTAGGLTMTAGSGLSTGTVDAAAGASLSSRDDMHLTSLTAGGAAVVKAERGGVELRQAEAGSVEITAGGSVAAETVKTSSGGLTMAAGSRLRADTIDAAAGVDISSQDDMHLSSLTAGGAAVLKTDRGAIELGRAEADSVDAAAGAGLTAGSVKANRSANLTGETSLSVETVTAGTDAALLAKTGDAAAGNVSAGQSLTAEAGGSLTLRGLAEAEKGSADLTAGTSISAGTVRAGTDARLHAAAGSLNAADLTAGGSITAGAAGTMALGTAEAQTGRLHLSAGDTLTAQDISAGKEAAIISDSGSVDVLNSHIGRALSVNAGRDIHVTQSDSVSLTMQAGGSILADGTISSGDISMKAGSRIAVGSGHAQLTGVDTGSPAQPLESVGKTGSLFLSRGEGRTYDPARKGSGVLATTTGLVDLEAGEIGIGTLESAGDAQVRIAADHVGVDDVEAGGSATFTITGRGSGQAAYAGLHSSTAPLRLTDSRIHTLALSGTDDIGILDTSLSGDSGIASDYLTVSMRERGGPGRGEWISRMILRKHDIDTDKTFIIVDGGTINGKHPRTAETAVHGRLYGDRYLGRQGRELAAGYAEDSYRAIGFAPAAEEEDYAAVMN